MSVTDVPSAKAALAAAVAAGQVGAAQQVPADPNLVAAITAAQETLAWLNERADMIGDLASTPTVQDMVNNAIDGVYNALSVNPGAPGAVAHLALWDQAKPYLPWIAGGAALVLGYALLFHRRGRR